MANPSIGYQNLLESATISVTSEETGFAKENAVDWTTFSSWKASAAGTVYYTADLGSSMSVDYWGAVHLLNDNSGTIKLQYSSDNFSADINDFGVVVTPSDNSPIYKIGTSVSARYWRFEIGSTGSASNIIQLSIGARFDMVRAAGPGWALAKDSIDDDILNQVSDGGSFLGRSLISKGLNFPISLTLQTISFVRGDWRTFIDHARLKPFFFSWDTDYDDGVYAWLDKSPSAPTFGRPNYVDVSIDVRGIR